MPETDSIPLPHRGELSDPVDLLILQTLSIDARLTLTEIASKVGLSASAVHVRIRRLEQRGVILGYRAVIRPESVGLTMTAFIEISPFDPAQPDDAPAKLVTISEIEACYSVAGESNYLLLVRVENPERLESLITEIRHAASVTTKTTVALRTFYEYRPLPISTV